MHFSIRAKHSGGQEGPFLTKRKRREEEEANIDFFFWAFQCETERGRENAGRQSQQVCAVLCTTVLNNKRSPNWPEPKTSDLVTLWRTPFGLRCQVGDIAQ